MRLAPARQFKGALTSPSTVAPRGNEFTAVGLLTVLSDNSDILSADALVRMRHKLGAAGAIC